MEQVDLSHYVPDFRIEVDNKDQPDLRNSITSVMVNEKVGGDPAQFTLVVADRFDMSTQKFVWLEQIFSPKSPLFFAEEENKKKLLDIYIGYKGKVKLKKLITGRLSSFSTTGFTSDIPQLNLVGYDISHTVLINKQESGNKKKDVKIEKDDTYHQIAERIAKKAGLTPITNRTEKYKPIILKNDINYIEFLKEAAKRVGFEFFITRGHLYFVNPRVKGTDRDHSEIDNILKFSWQKNLKEFIPTLNISSLVPTVKIRGNLATSKEVVKDETKIGAETVVEEKVPDNYERYKGSQIAEKLELNKDEIKKTIFNSKKEASDIAVAQLNIKNDNLVTASGSVVGNPDLLPGQFVEIEGIGTNLSGFYYITEVTNTIDSNGYTTKFNVRKNNILVEK